jgi:hypothetical protein
MEERLSAIETLLNKDAPHSIITEFANKLDDSNIDLIDKRDFMHRLGALLQRIDINRKRQ